MIADSKFTFLVLISFLVRVALVLYGSWQDDNMQVKYTDIDYVVITDAAGFVYHGLSPYLRATYRYSPLLSYAMLPNIFLFPSFGKILFCLLDIFIGIALYKLIRKTDSEIAAFWGALLWLLNPLSINISTRGSGESLICALVVSVLWTLHSNHLLLCSILLGLAVHVKIFPVLYAVPILFHLLGLQVKSLRNVNLRTLGRPLAFSIVSFLTFLLLTGIFYFIYGLEFMKETYFYHVTRADHRHNFSPYFYYIYLSTSAADASIFSSLLSFFPQLALLSVICWAYAWRDINFCLFLITLVFVAFNKVCTVQYFNWFLVILPLAMHRSFSEFRLMATWISVAWWTVVWICSLSLWLYFAYLLEFQGENTFIRIWLAGLLFFAANIAVICKFVQVHS